MTLSDISDEYVGSRGAWKISGKDGKAVAFSGTFLGFSSSQSETHSNRAHPGGIKKTPTPVLDYDGKSMRCSACRWSEFRLFKEEDGDALLPYLVHFTGMSTVLGEETRYRIQDYLTALEVIEVLTTRRGGNVYLSIPAARLLAQAAAIDDGPLKEAYNARLVP